MNHHQERIDNRLIIKSKGFVSPSTALYNRKYGVTIMKNCSCENNTEYLDHTTDQAAEYNFYIIKGQTLDFDVIYKDASKKPVNLTGYKTRCIAQYNDKTFTINTSICDCINGQIHLEMSAYETSRIFTLDYKYTNTTEYTYQLELISPSKNVYRVMEGVITVKPSAGSC